MRSALAGLALAAVVTAGCSTPRTEPLKLDGNLLTVDNQSTQDWAHVEIWLNYYYRVTADRIPAGARFQTPLDAFVESRGGRFNFKSMQVRQLRLTATLPDGTPLELTKDFQRTGLDRLREGR